MKILLRKWDDEVYVWKDATYRKNTFFVDEEDVLYQNIVSVSDDNRNKYVACSVCGEVFRKGSKQWEQHIKPVTDSSKCFDCRMLKVGTINSNKRKFTLLPNGKYQITQKGECTPRCGVLYWNEPSIDSEEARENCMYNRCSSKNATPKEITDIFTQYKGVFDELITVDRIVENGYTERNEYIEYQTYKLKAKNTIYARVNSLNIVDNFIIHYRNEEYIVCYSKKYDKLFMSNWNYDYAEFEPHSIPTRTLENIKAKIASLYA